jgi:hypothetical protein
MEYGSLRSCANSIANALAQILTVPPYIVAAIVLCTTAYYTDRFQSRGLAVAGSCFVGAIGYLIVVLVPNNMHARYFAVFCITSGTYTAIGVTIAWFAHNLGSETKKATGIPVFMAIGQCGSVLGTHLYPTSDAPRYMCVALPSLVFHSIANECTHSTGFATTCGLEALATICAIALYISYKRDNAKRDSLYGRPDPNASVNTSELADKVGITFARKRTWLT